VIHLIHGIHTQGASPVQGLIPFLERAGWEVKYPDYGYILGVETRIVNPIIEGALTPYVGPEDVLIGHSNGCAIIYSMLMKGLKVAGAVFINAALEQNIVLPPGCPFIHVYSNAGDEVTEAAKIGAALGIDDPVWGEMGHGGYNGTDPKIPNFFCDRVPYAPKVQGHSDFFTPIKLAYWGVYLCAELKESLA
jgi:hypothetical protein